MISVHNWVFPGAWAFVLYVVALWWHVCGIGFVHA